VDISEKRKIFCTLRDSDTCCPGHLAVPKT
jgi:hypothetical protein